MHSVHNIPISKKVEIMQKFEKDSLKQKEIVEGTSHERSTSSRKFIESPIKKTKEQRTRRKVKTSSNTNNLIINNSSNQKATEEQLKRFSSIITITMPHI